MMPTLLIVDGIPPHEFEKLEGKLKKKKTVFELFGNMETNNNITYHENLNNNNVFTVPLYPVINGNLENSYISASGFFVKIFYNLSFFFIAPPLISENYSQSPISESYPDLFSFSVETYLPKDYHQTIGK